MNDLVVHVLHYIIERRCRTMDIVEEKIPLYNRTISVRTATKPQRVLLAPSRSTLPFSWQDGYATVTVPEISGHGMVVLEGAARPQRS